LLFWAARRGINVIFENVKDDLVYIFEAGKDNVEVMGFPRSLLTIARHSTLSMLVAKALHASRLA